jgi:hypothetical protein
VENSPNDPLILPDRLDFATGVDLMEQMGNKVGGPLTIDGTLVAHLGAFSAQVLLSAFKQWAADDLTIDFLPSDACVKCWQELGFPEELMKKADLQ